MAACLSDRPGLYSHSLPFSRFTEADIFRSYFFNSLTRPVVALRLYRRGWGPAKITDVLNEHREIDPPYLRNTCSVKCTTSLRRGAERYGDEWDVELREELKTCDDAKATELIRVQEEECEEPLDIDIQDLLRGLKKHPIHDEDGAGLFTKCVQYCEKHKLSWMLSDVEDLAEAIKAGVRPEPSGRAAGNVQRVKADMQDTETEFDSTDDSRAATDIPDDDEI